MKLIIEGTARALKVIQTRFRSLKGVSMTVVNDEPLPEFPQLSDEAPAAEEPPVEEVSNGSKEPAPSVEGKPKTKVKPKGKK